MLIMVEAVLAEVGERDHSLPGAGATMVALEEAADAIAWSLALDGGLASFAERNQSNRTAMAKRDRTMPMTTQMETYMNRSAAKHPGVALSMNPAPNLSTKHEAWFLRD